MRFAVLAALLGSKNLTNVSHDDGTSLSRLPSFGPTEPPNFQQNSIPSQATYQTISSELVSPIKRARPRLFLPILALWNMAAALFVGAFAAMGWYGLKKVQAACSQSAIGSSVLQSADLDQNSAAAPAPAYTPSYQGRSHPIKNKKNIPCWPCPRKCRRPKLHLA